MRSWVRLFRNPKQVGRFALDAPDVTNGRNHAARHIRAPDPERLSNSKTRLYEIHIRITGSMTRTEAQISSRNAPADAHGNGVNSALGGGRAEASPAKIKSTEQNRTLCVRIPPLKQRSHNAVFCSPPLSRDRNSHSVSRFRRLPFLSVATAIQD